MSFPLNVWYAAAWCDDIGRELLGRTIANVPLVMFRKQDGDIAVLNDTCPHRFAPLHKGKLVGDSVECGYHGLHFNCEGSCVKNPHGDGKIPKMARIESYPVIEKHHIVWVWLGERAKATPEQVPDFPWLNEESYTFTPRSTMHMDLGYRLIIDNLLDLSHAAYLHPDTLGAEPGTKDIVDVSQEGNRIYSKRLIPDSAPAFVFRATGALESEDNVDYWADMRLDLPGSFYMDAGITNPGGERADGKILSSVQLVTPETENSSFYLWCVFRNYQRDNHEITDAITQTVERAFTQEDEPMIKAVQERMNGREFWSMKPLLLSGDGAAVLARRITDKLITSDTESA